MDSYIGLTKRNEKKGATLSIIFKPFESCEEDCMLSIKRALYLLKRWILYFMLFVSFGCVSMPTIKDAEIPSQAFQPSKEISLVIGRLGLFVDNQFMPFNNCNWLLYRSIKNLSEKTYGFRVSQLPDGYFVIALPPGHYVSNVVWTRECIAKTIKGVDVSKDAWKNLSFTFDVIPAKATYAGTIQIMGTADVRKEKVTKEPFIYKQPVWGKGAFGYPAVLGYIDIPIGKREVGFVERKYIKAENWGVNNDYEEAKKVFTFLYPNREYPIIKLAEHPQIKLDAEKQKLKTEE